MYYMNYFFVFSILGYLLETFFNKGFESGILYGPYTPVYGIGVCLVIFVFHFLKRKKINHLFTLLCIFLFGFIGLSILELLGGILIEYFFHTVFWDYSHFKLSIGHYIALEISLLWGILSILIAYIICPFFDLWIQKIPKFLTWLFLIFFIFDCMITLFTKVLF